MCERSVLDRADGSAKWSQEGSSVLAAVYGPRQAKIQKEDAERAVVEVVYKPRSGLQGAGGGGVGAVGAPTQTSPLRALTAPASLPKSRTLPYAQIWQPAVEQIPTQQPLSFPILPWSEG